MANEQDVRRQTTAPAMALQQMLTGTWLSPPARSRASMTAMLRRVIGAEGQKVETNCVPSVQPNDRPSATT